MSVTDWVERKLMRDGLSHLYEDADARAMNFDPGRQKLVCVSDLHRGDRNGADDFRRSERVYNAALAWYDANAYHLAVLGDAEELWECSPKEVLACTDEASIRGYARSLALERRFNEAGRYLRIYGNHDRRWASRRAAEKWLERHLGPVEVYGAVAITVQGAAGRIDGTGPPEIVLTHGDAGTLDSSLLAPFSKRVVHFWAFWQQRIGALTGVPADNWELREGQDVTMYEWARANGLLLIAGHTHRPVFPTRDPPEGPDEDDIRRLEAYLDPPNDLSAEERAAGEFRIAEMRRQAEQRSPKKQTQPCYFNTGACCFGDGDITAIEIADGEIRLMRWAWHPDENTVRAQVLEQKPLHDVLSAIHGGRVSLDQAKPAVPVDVNVVHEESCAVPMPGRVRRRHPAASTAREKVG